MSGIVHLITNKFILYSILFYLPPNFSVISIHQRGIDVRKLCGIIRGTFYTILHKVTGKHRG